MKTAVVTGASRGIGQAVAVCLLRAGYKVYGVSRDFSTCTIHSDHFIPMVCDVRKKSNLTAVVHQIREESESIDVLVNNAGVGFFGPHEQLSISQIEDMVDTNLKAPLILTNLLLRELKKSKGLIINISSVTAKKVSTHGCAYAATKAGLSHFANSLFDEIRKTGVRVSTIHPDMTQTNFYDSLDFTCSLDENSHLTLSNLSNVLDFIIEHSHEMVMTDISLCPQKHQIQRKSKSSGLQE